MKRDQRTRVAEFSQALRQLSEAERTGFEREVVTSLLDPDFYLTRYPVVRAMNVDPVEHFRVLGWREFKRPRMDFDLSWYWTAYLDPGQDEINPLVHYALAGMQEGLATRPVFGEARPAAALRSDPRRAILFAGYDPHGLVDETVIDYIRELARFGDVFYLADGEMAPDELAKLEGITAGAWAMRHGTYDFGSYSRLARDLVGWDRLESYDEVIFVNDSCCLVRPLDDVMAEMAERECDWWGLQATEEMVSSAYGDSRIVECIWRPWLLKVLTEPVPAADTERVVRDMFATQPMQEFHVGSYFVAVRKPVLVDSTFRRLLDSVRRLPEKLQIIERYEFGITRLLISLGYVHATYAEPLYPFHPVYTDWAFELIARGFPLLKRRLLSHNAFGTDLSHWQARLLDVAPGAKVDAIEAQLLRTVAPDVLARGLMRRADANGRLSHR